MPEHFHYPQEETPYSLAVIPSSPKGLHFLQNTKFGCL